MAINDQTKEWAWENLTGTALRGVLTALEKIPSHRAARVKLDSQSVWASVDAIPGPCLAVWLRTGAVYEVGEDGAVGEDPIAMPGKADQ